MKTLIMLIAFIQLGCSMLETKQNTIEYKMPNTDNELNKVSIYVKSEIKKICGDSKHKEIYSAFYKRNTEYGRIEVTCI